MAVLSSTVSDVRLWEVNIMLTTPFPSQIQFVPCGQRESSETDKNLSESCWEEMLASWPTLMWKGCPSLALIESFVSGIYPSWWFTYPMREKQIRRKHPHFIRVATRCPTTYWAEKFLHNTIKCNYPFNFKSPPQNNPAKSTPRRSGKEITGGLRWIGWVSVNYIP